MVLFLLACAIDAKPPAGGDDSGAGCDSPTIWYGDGDGDGFGSETFQTTACEQPERYVASATDCDDTEAAVSPVAVEVCNGQDDDCDGAVDTEAADATTFFADTDADGFGDATNSMAACAVPDGFTSDSADCDDASFATNPAAIETCNLVDDDCNDVIDDDSASDAPEWFPDADADTYGDPALGERHCEAPTGWIADNNDCDDARAEAFPAAPELCNLLDDDCDFLVDENPTNPTLWYYDADSDGYGRDDSPALACDAPGDHVASGGDCVDTNDAIHPLAVESCDTTDSDCDGEVAEDDSVDALTFYADSDGDGFGDAASTAGACAAPAGFVSDASDCVDGDAAVSPAADELCNGADDDCDGSTDENGAADGTLYYPDVDADGYGDSDAGVRACSAIATYLLEDGDCDDSDAAVNPDGAEVCDDGLDNDCSGVADDTCAPEGSGGDADADVTLFGLAASDELGYELAGGELTGDDAADLVLTDLSGAYGQVSLVSGAIRGTTTLAGAIVITGSRSGQLGLGMEVDDIDGDGQGDLLASSYQWGFDVVPGPITSGGGVDSVSQLFVADRQWSVVSAELDGDAAAELVATSSYNDIDIFDGARTGNLTRTDTIASIDFGTSGIYLLAAGDTDGDGTDDVVAENGPIYVFTNALVETTSAMADATYTGETSASRLAIADIDGDGLGDIVAASAHTRIISGGAASGNIDTVATASIHNGHVDLVNNVDAADFDADGFADVAVAIATRMNLFYGPIVGTLVTETDADYQFSPSGGEPTACAFTGDVLGTGTAAESLAIGVATDSTTAFESGAVYLFYGGGR